MSDPEFKVRWAINDAYDELFDKLFTRLDKLTSETLPPSRIGELIDKTGYVDIDSGMWREWWEESGEDYY